jgi:peptidoglycan/LPS O-acetylase OafA/YrhL
METAQRRYDIDWLRVIAIGLLLIYHITLAFQPWGVFIGFIQNQQALENLWIPMSMLNVWRIPLLFFVSGMGVSFAIRKRNWKQLIIERSRRILLPFIFGLFAIVPLHILLWQDYYNQDLSYTLNPSHLWFLGNIFIYVILLSPLFYSLKRNKNGSIHRIIIKLFNTPFGYLIIIAAFVLEALVLRPESFEMFAMTWHGFFLGLLAFFFGFIGVFTGDSFWKNLREWRSLFLISGLVLFVIRTLVFNLKSPDFLMSIESCVWIFAVFGFANRYLNKPGKVLRYLSQGAYPIYILHMVFLYLASYFIFPLALPTWVKFLLVVIATFSGCFTFYELIIRRIKLIRPLFGLLPMSSDT